MSRVRFAEDAEEVGLEMDQHQVFDNDFFRDIFKKNSILKIKTFNLCFIIIF